MLTERELHRYHRNIIHESWGKPTQDNLKSKIVFVAGTGGLGSPLLYYLAAAGVGNIFIADYDKLDISNLNRQILHNENRLGFMKVDSAYESLNAFNSEINIQRIYEKITMRNAFKLTSGVDLIIDCVDNFKTRHILNRVSVEAKVPLIHAGVSKFQGQMTFISPPDTACLSCFLPVKDKKGVFPIIGATAGVFGSLQAIEAIKFLTGIGTCLKNVLLFWDGLEMRFEKINLSKNPRCRVCK